MRHGDGDRVQCDMSIDEGALRALVDWQIDEGSLPRALWSTGEAATMTVAEHRRSWRSDRASQGRVPIVAGAG